VELFKLGEGGPPSLGIRTSEVINGFYSFLGFPRLTTARAIRRSIADGVQKGVFAYTTGTPTLGSDGKFQVDRARVAFERSLTDDEVDLESGFLLLPSAIPLSPASQLLGGLPPPGHPPTETPQAPITSSAGEPPFAQDKTVQFTFEADRNQLFTAWNAIANLADLAGKVKVSITANSDKGFDKNRLQNGVPEPLRETKLIE